MTLVAITGTPGTGKTSVSKELRSRGYEVIDINEHLRKFGLLGNKDVARDTYEVDMNALNDSLDEFRHKEGTIFMDSHLSHCLDCHTIIVLRCEPRTLAKRLRERGYNEAKVRENVQAELLDVILCEAMDSDIPVFEVDCTSCGASEATNEIVDIINGNGIDHSPGNVNWTGEMEEWF